MACFNKKDKQSGFTLVELAIVMIIIGLLIGGILKGQELVENAKFKRVQSDLVGFQSAFFTYKDKYGTFAGDSPNAQAQLPNCSGACVGGDGNGIVGIPNTNAYGDQTGTSAPNVETTMFWKHLALANLISGVDSNSDPAVPITGATHPKSSLGGAYSIYHRAGVHGISIKGCADNDNCNTGILEPEVVARFDRKYDGGEDPFTGDVIANGGGCLYGQSRYDIEGGACYLLFEIAR